MDFHIFADSDLQVAMVLDRLKHRKHSLRLKGYDYSQSGAYFVTICTHKRECVLGDVMNGGMKPSGIGKIAEQRWREIPKHFPNVHLDEFVVMPNHVHGIILIWGDDELQNRITRRGLPRLPPRTNVGGQELKTPTTGNYFSKISPKRDTLSVIIRTYKAAVTMWCRANHFKEFKWHRNFYDHIIRSEKSLNRIRAYIDTNPARWHLDRENPETTGADQFDIWLDSFSIYQALEV